MIKNLGVLSSDIKSTNFIINNKLTDHINLYSIASRNINDSKKIATDLNFDKSFGSYEELIEDSNLDIILNFLPSSIKFEFTYLALKLNKKVIVNYPIINSKKDFTYVEEILKSDFSHNLFLIDDYGFDQLMSIDNKYISYSKYSNNPKPKISATTDNLLIENSPDLFFLLNKYINSDIKIKVIDKKIDQLYRKLIYLNANIVIDNKIFINLIIDNINPYNSNHIVNGCLLTDFDFKKNCIKKPFNYDDLIDFINNNKTFVNDVFFQYYPFKLFNEVINE